MNNKIIIAALVAIVIGLSIQTVAAEVPNVRGNLFDLLQQKLNVMINAINTNEVAIEDIDRTVRQMREPSVTYESYDVEFKLGISGPVESVVCANGALPLDVNINPFWVSEVVDGYEEHYIIHGQSHTSGNYYLEITNDPTHPRVFFGDTVNYGDDVSINITLACFTPIN